MVRVGNFVKERTQEGLSPASNDSRRCPFCSSTTIAVHWKTANIWRCSSCNLLFRNPLKLQQEIFELYKNSWLNPGMFKNMTGGTNLRLARIYAQNLASSLGLRNFVGLKILDFGAGRGDMLTVLSELGADVYGIEPFGYDYLKNRDFKLFHTLEEVPEGFLFDGVLMIDVIEHLMTPWDTIMKLYRLLSDNGWFYIATPNANSLNARLFMSHWMELRNPSHIYFFTSSSIEGMIFYFHSFQYKRLRWLIEYKNNFLQNLPRFLLGFFKLDGELSYLLHKI